MVVMVVIVKNPCLATTASYHYLQSIWQLLPTLQVVLLLQIILDIIGVVLYVPLIIAIPQIKILQLYHQIKHSLFLIG